MKNLEKFGGFAARLGSGRRNFLPVGGSPNAPAGSRCNEFGIAQLVAVVICRNFGGSLAGHAKSAGQAGLNKKLREIPPVVGFYKNIDSVRGFATSGICVGCMNREGLGESLHGEVGSMAPIVASEAGGLYGIFPADAEVALLVAESPSNSFGFHMEFDAIDAVEAGGDLAVIRQAHREAVAISRLGGNQFAFLKFLERLFGPQDGRGAEQGGDEELHGWPEVAGFNLSVAGSA